jgi:hypothetical protein
MSTGGGSFAEEMVRQEVQDEERAKLQTALRSEVDASALKRNLTIALLVRLR